MAKKAVVYGATGFVGSGLSDLLSAQGYEVTGVSRDGRGDVAGVASWVKPGEVDLTDCHAVVNLAGVSIDRRWTEENKQAFYESRIGVAKDIAARIAAMPADSRPQVLVSASAIGIYGGRGDELLDESSKAGRGYLAGLCKAWEKAADECSPLGVRVVKIRIGVVLGKEGSAYRKLAAVFRAGLGGRLGDGQQWMAWIHVKDLRRAILFCITSAEVEGVVNGTAPEPVRNAEFTRKMADAVHRWVFLPVPGFALKLVLGGFGAALLEGQRALPSMLGKHGFTFRFRTLGEALEDLTS